MQLTVVLALVFIPTVLSAPALLHHKNGESETSNKGPSDTLQLDQAGFNNHQPIINLQNSEPRRGQSEFAAEKNGGPEVKRSERVDVKEEVEAEDEDVSKNMELADEEVKTVLKTFFRNLKRHPEIVEDILEREGAKLMAGQVLEEEGEEEQREENSQSAPDDSEESPLVEDDNTGDLPQDISDFQKPSPQLMKVPKQVEKKAGPFAGPQQFIYKSPMRNTKERDALTARSMNNPANKIVVSDNTPDNNIDNTNTPDHVDISNAIPVIQQNGLKEEPADNAESLLNNLSEGGDIDMAELERAEEEYSREHPFMNTLPIFPVKPANQEESEVEESHSEQAMELSNESEEDKSTEADDKVREEPQSEKRSKPEVTSEEDSEETESDSGSDSSEGKWAETQVVDSSSVESDGRQEVGKGFPELRPNPYYYYYNEDEVKDENDQLNASEEGEEEEEEEETNAGEGQDSDELELQKISEEEGSDELQEENGSDDSKEESLEEETDDTDEAEVDEPEDDDVINNHHGDDASEEKTALIPEADKKSDEVLDKNEADLLSLFRNSQQKSANLPIAGPPM